MSRFSYRDFGCRVILWDQGILSLFQWSVKLGFQQVAAKRECLRKSMGRSCCRSLRCWNEEWKSSENQASASHLLRSHGYSFLLFLVPVLSASLSSLQKTMTIQFPRPLVFHSRDQQKLISALKSLIPVPGRQRLTAQPRSGVTPPISYTQGASVMWWPGSDWKKQTNKKIHHEWFVFYEDTNQTCGRSALFPEFP